jgi:hypothetical protein
MARPGWVLGEHGCGTVLIQNEIVLSRALVILDEIFGWIYGYIEHTQLGTTGNTALSVFFTLYSSTLHMH